MNDKKIVVFGGAGFLGSHVSDALSNQGYKVTIFDSSPSQYLRDDQRMIVGDIVDQKAVGQALSGAYAAYNFAGIADIGRASDRPLDCVKYNVLGTTTILEECVNNRIERFLFASTIYVNSNHGGFYRATKVAAEEMLEAFHGRYGLDYTILRYGSLYGPRAQDWNGIYRYLKQAIVNGEIKFDGTGDERREYIHVYDAAKLSLEVLSPEFVNQRVNITGTQSLTTRELLTVINEILGGKVRLSFEANPASFRYRITPYNFTPKLAKKLTSNPFVDLGQGLLSMIREIHHANCGDQ